MCFDAAFFVHFSLMLYFFNLSRYQVWERHHFLSAERPFLLIGCRPFVSELPVRYVNLAVYTNFKLIAFL